MMAVEDQSFQINKESSKTKWAGFKGLFKKDVKVKTSEEILIAEICPCGKKLAITQTNGLILIIFIKIKPPNSLINDSKFLIFNNNDKSKMVTHIAWSHNCQYIAAAQIDYTLHIWSVKKN